MKAWALLGVALAGCSDREEAPCEPRLELSTTELDLGSVRADQSNTLWVYNTGRLPLGVLSIGVHPSGLRAEAWSASVQDADPDGPWILAAGASLPVTVNLDAGGEGGPTYAALVVKTGAVGEEADGDPEHSAVQVLLHADTPTKGSLLLDPGAVEFGELSAPTVRSLALANTGEADLELGPLSLGASCPPTLELRGDPAPGHTFTVPGGGRVALELAFDPGDGAPLTCELALGDRSIPIVANTPPAPDDDGDGYTALTDCQDGDATFNPGHQEVCDSKDNDCNGRVDDDCERLDSDPEVLGEIRLSPDRATPWETVEVEVLLLDQDGDDISTVWVLDAGTHTEPVREDLGPIERETLTWIPPEDEVEGELLIYLLAQDDDLHSAWAFASLTVERPPLPAQCP